MPRAARESPPQPGRGVDPDRFVSDTIDWYAANGRDLPWRDEDRSPWGVLVSEVMLQQTPVARVRPVWREWMQRWPEPADLAAAPAGEVLRAWGTLGYPRRALRLHDTASVIVDRYRGRVPDSDVHLRELPGVGDYTAAAVRAFAFGQRSVVLDTNVRRVLARLLDGRAVAPVSLTVAERRRADQVVPVSDEQAAAWSVAVMELGALVCTAAAPRCAVCPVRRDCAWVRAGRPSAAGPRRRGQRFDGTDRQARGRIMAVLRGSDGPVEREDLDTAWEDAVQRDRALATLIADGLVDALPGQRFCLPGEQYSPDPR